MTEYALAPNRKFTADSPYRTPRVMLEQDLLVAYRVRSNGTVRHLELLPLGSTKRETAEWINDAVDYDGRSVQSVARELHLSVATVRRFLEALELTEEIEAGEWDGLRFDADGTPVWDTAYAESDEEAAELAGCGPNSDCAVHGDGGSIAADQPCPQANHVEEILDQLAGMGKPAAQVEAELAATKAAQTAPRRTRRTRQPRPIQDVVAGQGLPWPSDEERAAALADLTANLRNADAPEPERTAETVLRDEPTLARTVQRRRAAQAAMAPQGRDLHVCGCTAGGPGLHAPGAPNCTTAPVARRPRSHG